VLVYTIGVLIKGYILSVVTGRGSSELAGEDKKIGMVTLRGCRCRCGHEWLPRGEEKPRVCPTCKSANWDLPYQFRRAARKPQAKEKSR
jgi:hypothetical protein